ncbi:hypothetical protein LNP26_27640 [Klebsiella variicola subsp. variicola]|nr:hypothetical protein [Klebsiella variicola subsp. variicola]
MLTIAYRGAGQDARPVILCSSRVDDPDGSPLKSAGKGEQYGAADQYPPGVLKGS